MEIIWDSKSLSLALQCEVRDGISTSIIQFNSRDIEPGDLFIALKGDNGNGHDYVQDALENGASAAIIENKGLYNSIDEKWHDSLIIVPSSLQALEQLALFKRSKSQAKFIAITGSVGKTSTKEIVGAIHNECAPTFMTRGNFNNHLGLLINLASLADNVEYAIFELGMNNPGEIAPLSKILCPDIVTITNIHAVHFDAFGSVEAIAREKADICAGCKDGIALLPADSPYYTILKQRAEQQSISKIYSFGAENSVSDIILSSYEAQAEGANLEYQFQGQSISLSTSLIGKHQAMNIAIGVLLAQLSNLPIIKVQHALQNLSPIEGRGNKLTITYNDNKLVIYNDCYNANTASMNNAIENFAAQNHQNKIAILGDMLELGDIAEEEHRKLSKALIGTDIHTIIAIGPSMKYLMLELQQNSNCTMHHLNSVEDFLTHIDQIITTDSMILVKASNGMRLNKFIQKVSN